jgi:hypothetical protein
MKRNRLGQGKVMKPKFSSLSPVQPVQLRHTPYGRGIVLVPRAQFPPATSRWGSNSLWLIVLQ